MEKRPGAFVKSGWDGGDRTLDNRGQSPVSAPAASQYVAAFSGYRTPHRQEHLVGLPTRLKVEIGPGPGGLQVEGVDGAVGFEPTNTGTKNRWLTACRRPKKPGPTRYWIRPERIGVSTPQSPSPSRRGSFPDVVRLHPPRVEDFTVASITNVLPDKLPFGCSPTAPGTRTRVLPLIGCKDSNLGCQNQNLESYRWTTPECDWQGR